MYNLLTPQGPIHPHLTTLGPLWLHDSFDFVRESSSSHVIFFCSNQDLHSPVWYPLVYWVTTFWSTSYPLCPYLAPTGPHLPPLAPLAPSGLLLTSLASFGPLLHPLHPATPPLSKTIKSPGWICHTDPDRKIMADNLPSKNLVWLEPCYYLCQSSKHCPLGGKNCGEIFAKQYSLSKIINFQCILHISTVFTSKGYTNG